MISETTFNSTITSTPPYSKLAIVFDEMMTNVNYRRWAKYILAILKKENFRNGKLLDIGCGTGQLLSRLIKTKYNLEGCDSSPEMLAAARKKLPGIRFIRASLPALDEIPSGKFDIMLCLFDTINYLMEPSALEQSFITIFEKLKRPGIFIFDVVTREHCEKYFQDLSETEIVKKQIAYSRDSFFDRKANIQNNIVRIYTPEGIFEEIHQQRIYNFQLIKEIISKCSDFQLSGCLEDFSFREATNKSSRIHFVLKKM